jgi:hypothetical protein
MPAVIHLIQTRGSDFLDYLMNNVRIPPLGQARDFSLVMIDLSQPVAEMRTQCFCV